MTDAAPSSDRRAQLIAVAARILEQDGPGAVTTRSVAEAAGVQAPVIYRLFGDKTGLLQAVTEDAMTRHVASKDPDADPDPIAGLRAGWTVQIAFGLEHPALFRLTHTMETSADGRTAIEAGRRVLAARVHRVAAAGRLAVPEARAVELIAAVGTGVVLALIERPESERDPGLADAAWRAVEAAILAEPAASAPTIAGPAIAAVTLRAALPELSSLTPAERALLGDWLERISTAAP